jgi:transposase
MIKLTFSKEIIAQLKNNIKIGLGLSNVRLYRLAKALFLFSGDSSIKEIAKLLYVNEKTIINWIKTFMHKGLNWLTGIHYQGRGRKDKLTKEQKDQLFSLITVGPEASGFHCGIWNSAMISEVIFRKFEVSYNVNYVSSLLKKIGLSYQ